MKTYILRQAKPVEPQKSTARPAPNPLPRRPLPPPGDRCTAKGPVLFIGLDVHNDSIAVSLAPSDATEVRRYGIIGGEHDDVLKLAKKLQAAHPGTALKFCYEAGPRGFALCRCLRAHGLDCILVCPSKVPRKPGERVKTDRRDADELARLYRAGELTGIYVPEPADEAMRDLIRARFQVGKRSIGRGSSSRCICCGTTCVTAGQIQLDAGPSAVSGQNQNALSGPADRLSGNARRDQRGHRAAGTLRPGDRTRRAGLALGTGGAGVDESARDGVARTRPRWWPNWATSTASSIPAS